MIYVVPGMRVPLLVRSCFFLGVFLHSRVTGACPVTTDLIMRVNVRTTTGTRTGTLGLLLDIDRTLDGSQPTARSLDSKCTHHACY